MPEFQVQIPAHDDGSLGAYVVMPEVTLAPAVIVIQEIFGINKEIQAKCAELATMGYIAIAPDLFWRIEDAGLELDPDKEDELQKAFDLYGEFDAETGIQDLKSTLSFVRGHNEVDSDNIGCVGFCLGGYLAFAMATDSDIDAAVSYYGVGISNKLDKKSHINKPLLMHIAENDQFVSAEEQQQIKDALADNTHVTIHTYAGEDHAFSRGVSMTAPEGQGAGGLANSRTREFFDRTLKSKAEAA